VQVSAPSFALVLLVSGCTSAARVESDGLCSQFGALADSIQDYDKHEIAFFTEWGAEPTKACRRGSSAQEAALCTYLLEHSSTEYMEANIVRVLRCAGVSFPEQDRAISLESLKGKATFPWPAFAAQPISMVVTFDTTSLSGAHTMTITLQRNQAQ
jgi:hypothetical protein